MHRLLLDERIRADGGLARVAIDTDLRVFDDDTALGTLSALALERVMVRYGRPLELADPAVVLDGDAIELANGARLRRFRYHAIVDTEARDYLVFERPGEEPLAVLATMATAAIRHLAVRRPSDS